MEDEQYKFCTDTLNALRTIFANVNVTEAKELPIAAPDGTLIHHHVDNEKGIFYCSYEFLNKYVWDTAATLNAYYDWRLYRVKVLLFMAIDEAVTKALQ